MNNWKIINKFAVVFGIIFIVFTVLSALMNYELNKVLYAPGVPASLFYYNMIVAMLPFLLAAVLSFVVAALGSQATKSAAEKEKQESETQPKPQAASEETPT
jgi:TRAP-type C4-dicarboxylate transport system permease small subunit